MKKLIFLCAVAISSLVISCKNDDDSMVDPLIGSWQLSEEFENGVLVTSDPCDLRDVLTFREDNTFESVFYEEDLDGNCEMSPDSPDNGVWQNLGNNNYNFIIGEEVESEMLNFSGDTFFIEDTQETFPGETIVFRCVYKRVLSVTPL